VTLIEVRDRIAAFEEPEISSVLTQVLVDQGVRVLRSATLERVWSTDEGVQAEVTHPAGSVQIEVDAILLATGRIPNTTSLGLENVGVQLGGGAEIIVDAQLHTSNPKIFAAGDVTGAPQFVYVAGAHGTLAVENALGGTDRAIDYRTLPRVTFTLPQVASVGLTEAEALRLGYEGVCRVVNLSSVPRALVNRDTRGLVKIVADAASRRVLGIHLLADGAADAILAGVYALEANFTVERLATTWAPYLTMAEAIRLGAQAFSRDVDLLSCCAS
jgi:mercuric reductase